MYSMTESAGEYFEGVSKYLHNNSVKGMRQGGKPWDNVKCKGITKYRPRGKVFDRLVQLNTTKGWGQLQAITDGWNTPLDLEEK